MVILEEGNLPHPRFPQCDILVPWSALKGREFTTAQCARGAERKVRGVVEEELQEIS